MNKALRSNPSVAIGDPETRTITTTLELLSDLSPDAQQRVLNYLASRLGTSAMDNAVRELSPNDTETATPLQRKGGRPKGSKNNKGNTKKGSKPRPRKAYHRPTKPISTEPLMPMSDFE